MGGKDKCQRFVSMGIVQPGLPYAFDMGSGFVPFRRDVVYVPAQEAPIAPLLDQLAFVEDRTRWGYKFRFGLFKVNDHDMALIAQARTKIHQHRLAIGQHQDVVGRNIPVKTSFVVQFFQRQKYRVKGFAQPLLGDQFA